MPLCHCSVAPLLLCCFGRPDPFPVRAQGRGSLRRAGSPSHRVPSYFVLSNLEQSVSSDWCQLQVPPTEDQSDGHLRLRLRGRRGKSIRQQLPYVTYVLSSAKCSVLPVPWSLEVKIVNVENPSAPSIFEPSSTNKHQGSEVPPAVLWFLSFPFSSSALQVLCCAWNRIVPLQPHGPQPQLLCAPCDSGRHILCSCSNTGTTVARSPAKIAKAKRGKRKPMEIYARYTFWQPQDAAKACPLAPRRNSSLFGRGFLQICSEASARCRVGA